MNVRIIQKNQNNLWMNDSTDAEKESIRLLSSKASEWTTPPSTPPSRSDPQIRTSNVQPLSLSLYHTINHPSLLPAFKMFAVSLELDNYLEFLIGFRYLSQHWEATHEKQSSITPSGMMNLLQDEATDCRNLFQRFFTVGSPEEVVLDPELETELYEDIIKGGSDGRPLPSRHSFSKAVTFAETVLQTNALPNFLKCDALKNFSRTHQPHLLINRSKHL